MSQHGAHLGPTGPMWAPCWPRELCYLGYFLAYWLAWASPVHVSMLTYLEIRPGVYFVHICSYIQELFREFCLPVLSMHHLCMLYICVCYEMKREIDMHVTNLSCYRIQLCIAVQIASSHWDVPSHARLFLEQLVYSDKQHIKATHFWLFLMKIHWWSMDFPWARASTVECGSMSWPEIWLVLPSHFSGRTSKLLTQQLVCTTTERVTKTKHHWLFVRRIH